MGSESLEVSDDEDDLTTVVLRERRDDEALVLPTPDRRDKSLLLEPMQCAAHRGSTQSQSFCDRAFGNASASRHDGQA